MSAGGHVASVRPRSLRQRVSGWLGWIALAGSLGCSPGSPAASTTEVRLRGEIKTLEQRTAELEQRLAEQQAELERLQTLLDAALKER